MPPVPCKSVALASTLYHGSNVMRVQSMDRRSMAAGQLPPEHNTQVFPTHTERIHDRPAAPISPQPKMQPHTPGPAPPPGACLDGARLSGGARCPGVFLGGGAAGCMAALQYSRSAHSAASLSWSMSSSTSWSVSVSICAVRVQVARSEGACLHLTSVEPFTCVHRQTHAPSSLPATFPSSHEAHKHKCTLNMRESSTQA